MFPSVGSNEPRGIFPNNILSQYNFGGISTFAHLPSTKCLLEPYLNWDIAIVGVPFDGMARYRPGQ
jgi:hypothetical protein